MNQINIPDLLSVLELPVSSFPLRNEMQPAQVIKQLEVFKKVIKEQRRSLVKKYHPDKPENKDDTKMKLINNAADTFLKMQLKFQRPRPVIVRVRYTYQYSGGTSTSTSTSTSGWL